MVSFDVFQRALDWDASTAGESNHRPHEASPAETPLTRSRSVHSALAKSDFPSRPDLGNDSRTIANAESGVLGSKHKASGSKETEIVRLQRALTDLKTANKAKEVLLRSVREELKNARETLNETFAEYCSLRDEMKTVKQNMARDHQAVVYRKDIELFALRKGNEQKEKYIKEHDAKLDEVYQQQRATVELKDAQLKMLKERLASLDRQASPKFGHDQDESGDHALEVRLLRIRKGRASIDSQDMHSTKSESPKAIDEKDTTIASLREQLELAKKASEEIVNQQGELKRAWEIVKKGQAALREERELHGQTREQLQELAVKLEEGQQQRSRTNSMSGRLPTIAEDKDELEAMFDTAQEDNLRLHTEIEALEKRLKDANARMFTAEQDAEALRVQIQLEKTISSDLESARPSVVHRVHFQRMEGQLKESYALLATKDTEITHLTQTLKGKEAYIKDLQAEVDAAVAFHTQDQDEIERLNALVSELQTTKDQLMRDHERAAVQRSRARIPSAPKERDSARSSGATLIQEASPSQAAVLTRSIDENALPNTPTNLDPMATEDSGIEALPPMPRTERNGSIQATPKRHLRSASSPLMMLVNDAPHSALRGEGACESGAAKRRSWGVRGFVKKIEMMVGKDDTDAAKPNSKDYEGKENPTPVIQQEDKPKTRTALSTKDQNAMLRPGTANSASRPLVKDDPFVEQPIPLAARPKTERRNTPRYYAIKDVDAKKREEERPQTAAPSVSGAGTVEVKSKDDTATLKASKRRSWGAGNRLKRRSLY